MSKLVWDKTQGTSEPPSDLPSGLYQLHFRVSQTAGDLAVYEFVSNNIAAKTWRSSSGQTFSPLALWNERDPQGQNVLILEVDLEGFWPQLIGIALAGLGLGLIAYKTLEKIVDLSETPAGQVALLGGGLLLIAIVGVFAFALVKTKGRIVADRIPG